MTEELETLAVEFPTAVRGYSKVAVDDFIRQIGQRLQSMQALLDEKSEMAEARGTALQTLKNDLDKFQEKEAAITKAYLSVEQRRMDVEQELSRMRADAHAEANAILDEARTEAAGIIAAAERKAEETHALAESSCALQQQRLTSLRVEFASTVSDIRRSLQTQLGMLPAVEDAACESNGSAMAIAF